MAVFLRADLWPSFASVSQTDVSDGPIILARSCVLSERTWMVTSAWPCHEKSQTSIDEAWLLVLSSQNWNPFCRELSLVELSNNHGSFPEFRLSRAGFPWGRRSSWCLMRRRRWLLRLTILTTLKVVEQNRRLTLS